MIKEIQISENKKIKINASMGWVLKYRAQFGHDILPDLLPVLESGLNIVTGAMDENGEITLRNILEGDSLQDAIIAFAGAEVTTALDILWAMAKNADEDTPAPVEWINSFENFPLDKIIPEAVGAIVESTVSEKNRKRLAKLKKTSRPKK